MSVTLKRMAETFAADRRFTVDEAKALVAKAQENGIFSRAEKLTLREVVRQYQDLFGQGVLETLAPLIGSLPPASASTGGAVVLSAPSSQRPVFLSKDGVFSLRSDGSKPANAIDAADALYRAAELVDEASGNLFVDHATPAATREKLFANLQADLAAVSGGKIPAGLTSQAALQQRSSVGTVMLQLLEASNEPALQQKIAQAYEAMVRAEPDARLRENLIFHLSNSAPAQGGEVKRISDALMSGLAPTKPPYEKWFANGNKTVNLSWTVGGGGEFWGGFTNKLKGAGFKPVGVESSYGVTTYEKTVNQPGVGETTFRISVREGGTNILSPMNDPNVQIVGYDGHSNWGRNMTSSVQRGPADATGGDAKLLFYNLCVGKGVLDKVREKYPNAQVATTYAASNFYTDGKGQMTTGEGVQALLVMIDGISKRADWQSLHGGMNRAANIGWGRTWDNYITPVSTLVREKVLDRDNDGQADYLDKHFNYNVVKVAEDTRREFSPVKQERPAQVLDGTKVLVAGQMINTLSEFSSILERANRDSKVVTNGYFEPKLGESDLVRFETAKGKDGKTEFRMQVNARYSHTSEETLRLLTAYEFNRWLTTTGQLKMDPVDAKLAGMILAAQSLKVDDGYRDREVWGQFLSRFNLPQVELSTVNALLDAEHHHYSGSPEMVRALRAKLSPELLAAFAAPEVGAPIKIVG